MKDTPAGGMRLGIRLDTTGLQSGATKSHDKSHPFFICSLFVVHSVLSPVFCSRGFSFSWHGACGICIIEEGIFTYSEARGPGGQWVGNVVYISDGGFLVSWGKLGGILGLLGLLGLLGILGMHAWKEKVRARKAVSVLHSEASGNRKRRSTMWMGGLCFVDR